MILFRADGNKELGSGHIMRCLTIAESFREQGFDCTFVTADNEARKLITAKGFQYHSLYSQWNNIVEEIPAFASYCDVVKPQAILLDHYFATEDYISSLRKHCPVVYMDDLNTFTHSADVVLNYNIYAESMDYRQRYEGTSTQLLLGPQYAPLRAEFRAVGPKKIRHVVSDVLVSTGGADPKGIGIALLQAVVNTDVWKETTFHFIVGALNSQKDALKALAEAMPNIVLHENVRRMDALMQQCDVAISAAGSTQYELCACGVPTINYVLADNQIPGAKGFEAAGLMFYAGDCRKSETFIESILTHLELLIKDPDQRQQMSNTMQLLVDGGGADRFVCTLITTLGL